MTSPLVLPPLQVFAQSAAPVDIDAWSAHASRFFATRIGLGNEEGSFVIAPDGQAPGIRAARVRPCTPLDFAAAEAAERKMGGGGMGLLARRCSVTWSVERETATDALALRLAAILASVLLGPILDASTGEIFGVKTARAKLEALAQARTS